MRKVVARQVSIQDISVKRVGSVNSRNEPELGAKERKMCNTFLTILASAFLAVGSIGVVMPLLPTTPFLILSLYCYTKAGREIKNEKLRNIHKKLLSRKSKNRT